MPTTSGFYNFAADGKPQFFFRDSALSFKLCGFLSKMSITVTVPFLCFDFPLAGRDEQTSKTPIFLQDSSDGFCAAFAGIWEECTAV